MLRFKIRDLLWLTVVVALAVGWWVEGRSRRQVEAKLQKMDQAPNRDRSQHVFLEDQAHWHRDQWKQLKAEKFKLEIALVEARARIQVEDEMAKARARASRPSSP